MIKKYTQQASILIVMVFILFTGVACKKHTEAPVVPLATLGLYEYSQDISSVNYKRLFMPITQIGTQAVTYYGVFDTGSTGLTLDAADIIPAAMITSSGITFTGDSVDVNGITIMKGQTYMAYGDATSSTKEYGYLAYAPFTLGDANGKIVTKRIPFFLYYKIIDGNNKQLAAHSSDVFGVGPGTSYASNKIASPLSYFTMPANVTNGFKLATLTAGGFSSTGTYVKNLLSIGLTPDDLSSAGFVMHSLTSGGSGGYSANIPATITYGNTTVTGAQILFDTGTPAITVIEDKTATAIGSLPTNTVVTIVTNMGFRYSYTTTSTGNLTAIQNPNKSGDYRTIFSLNFFIDNEYLTDYSNHRIGLKNN